jgi:hypothetical protein
MKSVEKPVELQNVPFSMMREPLACFGKRSCASPVIVSG